MKPSTTSLLLSIVSLLLLTSLANSTKTHHHYHDNNVVQCFKSRTKGLQDVVYTPSDKSYESVLDATISNRRFLNHSKPIAIFTPVIESQVQTALICAKKHRLRVRIRSGGHDNEGLSYVCHSPFIVIDLHKINWVSVNVEKKTASFGAGATLGQVYHAVALKSKTLAFVAGDGPTVGTGGHISQGGINMMCRRFGVAADQVINARIIDVNGDIKDRKSMGEDLFWAIRGGGGDSFGIIISYEVKLHTVPEKVTAFVVTRTLEQNATELVHKWQYVAPKTDKDLLIRVYLTTGKSPFTGNKTVMVTFGSLYLGDSESLLKITGKQFPELGLTKLECMEMNWIDSVVFFAFFNRSVTMDALLTRTAPLTSGFFKGTSDFVKHPISKEGLRGFWRELLDEDAAFPQLQLTPLGGRMEEISESEIAFAHRGGNIYLVAYASVWVNPMSNLESEKHVNWVRKIRGYMTPYVSKSPRSAYVSFRDLDVGQNNVHGETSYAQASVWGKSYFGDNFDKLVKVKTKVDPHNFFRNEQSFPSRARH